MSFPHIPPDFLPIERGVMWTPEQAREAVTYLELVADDARRLFGRREFLQKVLLSPDLQRDKEIGRSVLRCLAADAGVKEARPKRSSKQ